MDIEFGWCLDGATWADAVTASDGPDKAGAALGRIRLGPRGLLRLLQTRLGLSHPGADPAVRIAQHLASVLGADHAWCRRSLAVDPWATARELLALRDAAVEAGWDPFAHEGPLPPRLDALRAIERARRETGAVLSAGVADDLVEVLDLLASEPGWPLGITSLACQECPEDLPGLWGALLSALADAGVPLTVQSGAPSAPPRLEIIRCDDEWEAATVAARFVAGFGGNGPAALLATEDTIALDAQLHRRGRPAVGRAQGGQDRARQQILPLFLALAIAPVDVHQLAALLDLRVVDAPEPGAQPIGLVPARARAALLSALAQEPGVGGEAWRSALDSLRREAEASPGDRAAVTAHEAARAIDELVRSPLPAQDARPSALRARLPWLRDRLRAVGHLDTALTPTITQITAFDQVLTLLEDSPLSPRMLQGIVASCGGTAPSPFARREAGGPPVALRPAHLQARGGTVLWWGATESRTAPPTVWDADEIAVLRKAGASPADPQAAARLETAADLRGLASAGTLVVVHADRRLETDQPLTSLLAHLATGAIAAQGGDAGAAVSEDPDADASASAEAAEVEKRLEARTRTPQDLASGPVWELAGSRLDLAPAAEEENVEATRSRIGPGDSADAASARDLSRTAGARLDHLLPERLSYSQAETLIGCRQKWTYRYGLGLRPGSASDLPTGNRMIGTLVHAVVERLVRERDAAGATGAASPWPPDDAAIGAAFDALVPHLASELDLPGRSVLRARVRDTALRSLAAFFGTLEAAGHRIVDVETDFDEPLPLTVDGAPRTVAFRGARDVDTVDAAGHRGVIDLKWTDSRTKHAELYDRGEAIQLASYAWSIDRDGADVGAEPPSLAYFLLQQGEFVSEDTDLDGRRRTPFDPSDAWRRLVAEVEAACAEVGTGRISARPAQELLDRGMDLGTPWKARHRVLEEVASVEHDAGGIWINARCDYCEFTTLCGIGKDLS